MACADIGSGTGKMLLGVPETCERLTAIDPDEDMLAHVKTPLALDLLASRMEDVDLAPRSLDGVVCGTAFHWFDEAQAIDKIAHWLRPGGVFLLLTYTDPQLIDVPGPAREFLQQEKTRWQECRSEQIKKWSPPERGFREHGGFGRVTLSHSDIEETWTPERLIGFYMTTSYGRCYSDARPDPDLYRNELTQRFHALCHGRSFGVRFPVISLLAKKN